MVSSATGIKVNSPNTKYSGSHIYANHTYRSSIVERSSDGELLVTPRETHYQFKTDLKVPRLGLMLVGWGGNNGTTVTAAILANRRQLSWETREGEQQSNYFGSVALATTLKLGVDKEGKDVYVPFSSLLPMVHPNDMVIGGWDISSDDLATAMDKAKVLQPELKNLLRDEMKTMKPLPSIFYPNFVADNQKNRANNVLPGSKKEHLDKLRNQIRSFKNENKCDKVIVLWTATTGRYAEVTPGVNDTMENMLKAIDVDHPEISPSSMFAVASILEGCPFINGSPQNTFVPAVRMFADIHNVPIAGDDFKSGQTKLKAVLTDFLINAGIKPLAITSYNHLGNNDGLNLSSPLQFRSKEISKSGLVDDMVATNPLLYKKNEVPDHTVVIKYVPAVGDSKRALDEYYSEIFMGGRSTIAIHNTCEDSLLASPLILDLAIFCELLTRIQYRIVDDRSDDFTGDYSSFHPVLSLLAYFLKAPQVPPGAPLNQSLFKQRNALETLLRSCVGLDVLSDLCLEHIAK